MNEYEYYFWAEKFGPALMILLGQFFLITLPLVRIGNRLDFLDRQIAQLGVMCRAHVWPKSETHS